MRTHSGMARSGLIYCLRIEIDGHYHGGPPVKPWVAEITGTCPRYGLKRAFLRPMNDWEKAHVAWSGNTYGVVATYPLRDGRLYEVSRCRGNPSRRHVTRAFMTIADGRQRPLEPIDALARVDGGGAAAVLSVREGDDQAPTGVSRVMGLGELAPLGFVLVDGHRFYRLPPTGLYAVVERGDRRLVGVTTDGELTALTQAEALSWLS